MESPVRRRGVMCALALVLTLAGIPVVAAAAEAPGSTVIAFVHASVIPMDRERVLADQAVVVSDGTIVAL